jgi:uncharacterized protein (TIGR03083 family)
MGNTYSQPNTEGREHLARVVARMKPSDFARPAGGPGWTVGGLLAHLAFYDNRARVLLTKWKKDGVGPSGNDVDVMNESMRPLFNLIPGDAVARLVTETAGAIDREIDSLPPDLLARVEKDGPAVKLNRGLHRAHHLAQIEKAMGGG